MISRSVPEMPVHLLNGRLRTLLRYGLISRCSRQLAFQNVEYRLTRFGKKITEIVDRLDELDLEFGSVMPVGDVRDPADLGQGEEVAGPMNGKAKAQELMSGSENRPERKLLKVPAENPLCDAKVTEK